MNKQAEAEVGGALSARFHFILRLLFFFSRKRAFLSFDFYYFGVRQFLLEKNFTFFWAIFEGTQEYEKAL